MNFFRNITSKILRAPDSAANSGSGSGGSQESPKGAEDEDSEIDDAVLVAQAQAGDYGAFDKLVTRHQERYTR